MKHCHSSLNRRNKETHICMFLLLSFIFCDFQSISEPITNMCGCPKKFGKNVIKEKTNVFVIIHLKRKLYFPFGVC